VRAETPTPTAGGDGRGYVYVYGIPILVKSLIIVKTKYMLVGRKGRTRATIVSEEIKAPVPQMLKTGAGFHYHPMQSTFEICFC